MANKLTKILGEGTLLLALAGSANAEKPLYQPGFYPQGPIEERTNGVAPGFVDYVQKGVEVKNYRRPVNHPIELGYGWSLSNWREETYQTVEPAERHSIKWKYEQSNVKTIVDSTKSLPGKIGGWIMPKNSEAETKSFKSQTVPTVPQPNSGEYQTLPHPDYDNSFPQFPGAKIVRPNKDSSGLGQIPPEKLPISEIDPSVHRKEL